MTVFFRPCGDILKAPAPRTDLDRHLYTVISEHIGVEITVDAGVDYEDWVEPVCMLEQAIHLGLEIKVLPAAHLRRAVMNPLYVIPGKACRDILIGRQQKSDPYEMPFFDLGWPAACDSKANHYAELETFHRHAGRKLALADMPGDRAAAGDRKVVFGQGLTSTALGTAMASLAPGDVIVKQVYPGKALPLLTYTLDKDFDASKGQGMFFEDVEFHFARYEGDPASLLVQEKVTMTHETRFFVVGGKVITGAACIESHTPMDDIHWDTTLPPVWEITRNSGEMDTRDRMDRKRTALKMWQYAWQVAEEIAREAPGLDAYVLDVALDAQGEPLVIELNPVASSGLYANNTILLMDAIVAYAENAPHREVESWNPDDFVGDEGPMSPTPIQAFALSTFDTCSLDGEDDEIAGAGNLISDDLFED